MFKIIFTSDNEIHGNGEGNPKDLIIEPTNRMMSLFNQYGAKLTIIADVAEMFKFQEYFKQYNRDDFYISELEEQLKAAVATGHDVQLHIHSSYYNSVYINKSWKQDYSEYDLTKLKKERLNEIIKQGKNYLEDILKPVNSKYNCFVFRAANWSMIPSENIVSVLIENGFTIDTSVFKYGKRTGLVSFDYSSAVSDLLPWQVSNNNICDYDSNGKLYEVPIYCENKPIWTFLTVNRLYRVLNSRLHRLGKPDISNATEEIPNNKEVGGIKNKVDMLFKKNAWKMDFNQCTGQQLIRGLLNAEKKYQHVGVVKPFVLIGHSKLFTKANEKSLQPFLKFIKNHPDRFSFGVFKDLNLSDYNNL